MKNPGAKPQGIKSTCHPRPPYPPEAEDDRGIQYLEILREIFFLKDSLAKPDIIVFSRKGNRVYILNILRPHALFTFLSLLLHISFLKLN